MRRRLQCQKFVFILIKSIKESITDILSHTQFYFNIFKHRHAWLNLRDKCMTTGRINQVSLKSKALGVRETHSPKGKSVDPLKLAYWQQSPIHGAFQTRHTTKVSAVGMASQTGIALVAYFGQVKVRSAKHNL